MKTLGMIILPILLVGCSWITSFIIVNNTDSPILIEYRVANLRQDAKTCPDEFYISKPQIKSKKEIDNDKVPWIKLDEGQYECEKETKKISFSLQPGMVVKVFTDLNYHGYRNESEYQKFAHVSYPITSLKIKGMNGEIEYSGSKITKDFEKVSRAQYVLTYE